MPPNKRKAKVIGEGDDDFDPARSSETEVPETKKRARAPRSKIPTTELKAKRTRIVKARDSTHDSNAEDEEPIITKLTRRSAIKKKWTTVDEPPTELLQSAFNAAQQDVTGMWIATSEPDEPGTHGAMQNTDIIKFESQQWLYYQGGRLMCNLGCIAAMRKGDVVFWYDRCEEGITGMLQVDEDPDSDPTIEFEPPPKNVGFKKKARTKKSTFAWKVQGIVPGIQRVKLSWVATFQSPVTSKELNSLEYLSDGTMMTVTTTTTVTKSPFVPLMQLTGYNVCSRSQKTTQVLDCPTGIRPSPSDACWDPRKYTEQTTPNGDGTYTTVDTLGHRNVTPFVWWWQTGKRAAFCTLQESESRKILELATICRSRGSASDLVNQAAAANLKSNRDSLV